MIKTIDDITFMGNEASFTLSNSRNRAFISFIKEDESIHFRDSVGNTMLSYPATISINFEVFKLTTIGQTINSSDGTVNAYLSKRDVQELAENSFYEEGQTRVFDFMKLEFTVAL
jgi:hypothetical protein